MSVQPSASRFQWVERPVVGPGKCIVCGSANRPCVDFGLNFDRYGAVYFCEDCIGAAARVFGFKSIGEIAAGRLGAEQSATSFLQDNGLVAVPRDFFELVGGAASDLSSALDSAIHFLPDTDDEVESGTVDVEPETPVGESGQDDSTSGESGPNDVPSDSSDEFDFLGAR